MGEKFNKYFNSTTINGRANVAKATYASFALMYLIYRIRKRGANDTELKDGDCGCHGKMDAVSPYSEENHTTPPTPPPPPPPSSGTKKKEDCPVCRDRAPKQHKDNQGADHGAPSPGSSDTKGKRRKCPCEDPHLHTDSDEWSLRKREYDENETHDGCASYTPGVSITEDKPTNMHETIYRALRGMLGAVIGGNDNDNETNGGANGNIGNNELDFLKMKKDKIEKTENGKKDDDKARTKDDDYLDGIGSDMYNED